MFEPNFNSVEQDWHLIQKVFLIKSLAAKTGNNLLVSDVDVQLAVQAIKKLRISKVIVNLTLERIWDHLRETVCPKFWGHFISYSKESLNGELPIKNCIAILVDAVNELHQNIVQLLPYIERCEKVGRDFEVEGKLSNEKSLLGHLKLHLRATLLSQMPINFTTLIYRVYSAVYKIFCFNEGKQNESVDLDDSSGTNGFCQGCLFYLEECKCLEISRAFCSINKVLQELELLERLAGGIIDDLLLSAIDNHISSVCKDSYDKYRLPSLEEWLNRITVKWLEYVYFGGEEVNNFSDKKSYSTKFQHQTYKSALYHKYTSTRIDQLFNIVIEFPESQPALEDLRQCLEKTDLRNHLVKSLSKAIQTRLLHPGVTTEDILHAYIAAIKALRVLDPKGILLELVSEPIRTYLRGRNDFVRYIAISLTDYSCSELSDELVVAAPLVLDDSYSEVEDMNSWDTWTPDPTHAQCSVKSKSQRTADIISMLVNIYGSKTIFINEYGNILADRILTQFSYDTQREIMYLEHLKVRFGESLSPLHKCEVMVKDVADSKRINTYIHSDQNPHNRKHKFPVSAMILSAQFWPSFKEQSLQVPKEVKEEMNIYTQAFQELKGNRTLNWKPHLGQVQLEIELKNRTLNLTVTPTKATIIHHFEKKPKWVLDDLSRVTLIPKGLLRQKIAFWQAQGLIQESEPDVFILVEDEDVLESQNGCPPNGASIQDTSTSICIEEESESVMASAQDQRQEELQVLWSYIVGMLTNLDSLPLERIHAMLKMFIRDTVECSVEELRLFLEGKIRHHEIILTNGTYRLPKN